MARVTAAEVKEIIDTTRTTAQINAVITAANLMVTNTVGSESSVSTALAKELERWLTAHMLAITVERQEIKGEVGDIKAEYAKLEGKGFDSTTYGMTLLEMDPTGNFAALGRKAVKMTAVTSFS